MKRLLEAVRDESERLSLLELSSIASFYQSLLLERRALVSEQFFQVVGSDLFVDHVLNPIAHKKNISQLLELRLVSKIWSELVYLVGHVKFGDKTVISEFPVEKFKRLTSLSLKPMLLMDSVPLTKITQLFLDYQYPFRLKNDKRRSLAGWTSLRKLTIDSDCTFKLDGLIYLTQLTSLSCGIKCFKKPQDIFLMTQLKSLTLHQFPTYETIADKLPNLSYLSSDSSEHFLHFTGDGKLSSTCELLDEKRIKNKFFYYTIQDGISAKGKWESGIFTGKVSFYHLRPFENINKIMEANMVNGKFEGFVKEEEYCEQIGTYGMWCAGKKEGHHIRYKWCDDYENFKTTHDEIWKRGKLIETNKCI